MSFHLSNAVASSSKSIPRVSAAHPIRAFAPFTARRTLATSSEEAPAPTETSIPTTTTASSPASPSTPSTPPTPSTPSPRLFRTNNTQRNTSQRFASGSSSFSSSQNSSPTGTLAYTLHVTSTPNNVILSFTNTATGHKLIPTITGGSDKKFKKANRSSYEAAYQAAVKMFDAIQAHESANTMGNHGGDKMALVFKGLFGQGRDAVLAALVGPDGKNMDKWVGRVEDRTPIKIGGTRAPKPRRL